MEPRTLHKGRLHSIKGGQDSAYEQHLSWANELRDDLKKKKKKKKTYLYRLTKFSSFLKQVDFVRYIIGRIKEECEVEKTNSWVSLYKRLYFCYV